MESRRMMRSICLKVVTANGKTIICILRCRHHVNFSFSRFLENLPDLEELESKLNAYYALEKESKR